MQPESDPHMHAAAFLSFASAVPKGARVVGLGVGGTRTWAEAEWANNRPLLHRPPMCRVGDRVLYRSNEWRDEVEAIVVDVLDFDLEDPNVFYPDATPREDPWPVVHLRLDPAKIPADWDKRRKALVHQLIGCREARLAGAAGWLPMDWRRWPRPGVLITA